MVSMDKVAAATLLAALALAAPAAAQTTVNMPANNDLIGMSCGEFLATLAVANPGQNPTSDRQAQAQRAQNIVFYRMLWASGYLTARNGVPPASASFTRDWITTTTGAIAAKCKANPNQSFYQAVGAVQ